MSCLNVCVHAMIVAGGVQCCLVTIILQNIISLQKKKTNIGLQWHGGVNDFGVNCPFKTNFSELHILSTHDLDKTSSCRVLIIDFNLPKLNILRLQNVQLLFKVATINEMLWDPYWIRRWWNVDEKKRATCSCDRRLWPSTGSPGHRLYSGASLRVWAATAFLFLVKLIESVAVGRYFHIQAWQE